MCIRVYICIPVYIYTGNPQFAMRNEGNLSLENRLRFLPLKIGGQEGVLKSGEASELDTMLLKVLYTCYYSEKGTSRRNKAYSKGSK